METSTLVARDTLVSTASELIGGALDLAVAPDGRLYLSDFRYQRILTLRPDGTDVQTIGREGSGPGEFLTPWSIGVSADSLWVYDMPSGRVQVLDRAGHYAREFGAALPSVGRGRALDARGQLAAATGGRDSALVAVITGVDSEERSIGRPVAPPATFFDFGSIRETILRGEIPEEYRNDALPVWGKDGSLFLAFYSEPNVFRYGPSGDLVWTAALDDPVLASARSAFVRKNRENQDPGRLYSLQYIADGQEVGGDLWLLLNTEDEADGTLLVLDGADGTLKRRIVLSGLSSVGPFAVDSDRGRLYVTIPDEAMLLAFSLE